jgi:predicted PurR-regulated permease PerM
METANDKAPRPHSAGSVWGRRRDIALAILGWGAIIAAALWLAGHVLSTLIIMALGALLAYALVPVVTSLERIIPRWLAITLTYIGLLIVLAAVLSLVVSSLITQITGLAAQITAALSASQPGANAPLYSTLLRLGLTADQINGARDYAAAQLASAAGGLAPFLAGALTGVFDLIVVIVLSIYFMADGQRVSRWMHTGLPLTYRHRGALITDTIERVAGGYIRGQLILCGSIGLLVGLGMWALGVPFAALLGVLAFFLEFIPFLGPPISAAFAVLLAWPQGWLTIGLILAWFVLIHILEGYVLQPRLVGHSVGVNPTIMILAALAGGEVFGLWGALFAAPVAGVAQSLLIAIWHNWRDQHPEEFTNATPAPVKPAEEAPSAEAQAI